MSLLNAISRQGSDVVAYVMLPVFSVLVPGRVSRWLVRQMAGWHWLLATEAEESCAVAADYTAISDPRAWQQRWRHVVLLEVRDLALLAIGRRQTVFDEIEGMEALAQTRDSVLIGMHWGPSIAILSMLQSFGLGPLLVYRSVERSIVRQRPWYYFFLVRSVRYIKACCAHRAIPIIGAGAALRVELSEPGTAVVVMDAPPMPNRSTLDGTVIGRPVRFNAGFPGILKGSGRAYRFYALSLKPGSSGLRELVLSPPAEVDDEADFMRQYCEFLSQHIAADSPQWRIWQVAGQFFVPPPTATKPQTAPPTGASQSAQPE